MKNIILLVVLFAGVTAHSQEFKTSAAKKIPALEEVEETLRESYFIGPWKSQPRLSIPVRELPEMDFSIREVDFSQRKDKRQVDLVAMMERKRYEKEKGIVELDSPTPNLATGEKTLLQVTNDIRMNDRSSNFDFYTGQKKIPAYEEMRVPLFRSPYYSRSGVRAHVSPNVYFNPYLR